MSALAESMLAHLDTVLRAWPSAVSIRFERAKLLAALNRAGDAEAEYRAVLAIDPTHFRSWNDLGLLYYQHGLPHDAEQCFIAAVAADPANATGEANLGGVLLARDEVQGAREHFERALALRPDHPAANAGLVAAYARLGLPVRDDVVRAAAPGPVAAPAAIQPLPLDAAGEYVYDVAANAILRDESDAAYALLDAVAGGECDRNMLWRLAEFADGQRHFEQACVLFGRAIAIDPQNADLHMGLAVAHEKSGDAFGAATLWRSPILRGRVRVFPYEGSQPPVRVLTIASALHALRYDLFIRHEPLHNVTIYTQAYDPAFSLPEHDVVLNAVADTESDERALGIAEVILRTTSAPVINPPAAIAATGRAKNAERLGVIDGVTTAKVVHVTRDELLCDGAAARLEAAGFTFPVLLRGAGFHNGRFFESIDDAPSLAPIARTMPANDVLVIAYIDTRSPDGLIRKYRVMTIGGVLYPVHLAIAPQWKVHYVTSVMHDNEALRREEAAFLTDMRAHLGDRAMAALEAVAATIGLDYGGIDFGIAPDGDVVVFEANGAMAIFVPDADPRWDYRRAPMERALHAASAMLAARGREKQNAAQADVAARRFG